MSEKEIAQFLSSLASELHVSAATQNQALNAILFLYRDVLRKEIGYVDGVIRAKRPHRLPVVLTRQEVKSVLGILDHSNWLMVMLVIRLQPICLKTGVTSARFRNSSATVM
jgi:site-specific recombinase XerD